MGFAAADDDEIACGHADRWSTLERDHGRASAQIVEHGIRKLWQRQAPGTAKLVMEQQGPLQANAIEHVSESVHAYYVDVRTIEHKIRTIAVYRPRPVALRSWLPGAHGDHAGT